jgi:hypothetical protein
VVAAGHRRAVVDLPLVPPCSSSVAPSRLSGRPRWPRGGQHLASSSLERARACAGSPAPPSAAAGRSQTPSYRSPPTGLSRAGWMAAAPGS